MKIPLWTVIVVLLIASAFAYMVDKQLYSIEYLFQFNLFVIIPIALIYLWEWLRGKY